MMRELTSAVAMGVIDIVIAALLFVLIPKEGRTATSGPWFNSTVSAFKTVFKKPQSILCGP